MPKTTFKICLFFLAQLLFLPLNAQKFQGTATYISKSKMNLGNWGARLSEGEKKQVKARLKNRLEKNLHTYF
jgi:hypothetical protein